MRFTDIERNIVFGSTEIEGLSKDRIKAPSNKSNLTMKPHYSSSGKGFWLWGTKDVYRDNMVSTLKLNLHANFT